MGRKSISVPSLAHLKTPSLRTPEWWEGVRGGVRDSVRYFGERIPQKFSEIPVRVHEDVEKLQRKLSLASLLSKEDLQETTDNPSESDQTIDSNQLSDAKHQQQRSDSEDFLSRFARDKSSERRRDESRLRDRLSLMMPKYESIENTIKSIKSVKKDLGKLRSKSCDRILKRRKSGGRVSPVLAAAAAAEYDEEYFQINSTLRRSRRLAEKRKKKYTGPYVGLARARVDCTPSPYDTEALPYKAGDLIQIIWRRPSGIWSGECRGRTGTFKFINVEEIEEMPRTNPPLQECTVVGLLSRLDLAHLTSKLVLNGWDTLRKLGSMTRQDLVYLGVEDKAEQDKLLTAVTVLQDLDGVTGPLDGVTEPDGVTELRTRSLSRMDSGYYDIRDTDSESSQPTNKSTTSTSSSSSSSSTSPCDTGSVILRKLPKARDSMEESNKIAQALNFFESPSPEVISSSKKVLLAESTRKRFDSINESRLSLAEPNPILNKSF